ncbi:amino acid permease [Nonomuraea thailandensis]
MPEELARRLGTTDAVVVGLSAMIGAGVFAAFAPAAAAAGHWLLASLALAAVVAYCNATSSARLAALYPESGGTYVYGRRRLGPCGATWRAGASRSARPPPARPWRSPSAPTCCPASNGRSRSPRWPC